MVVDLESSLQHYFGFSSFRPGQREAISALLAGHDVLATLTTGTGKSLIYQLAGLILNQPVLVVTPLIALMEDQQTHLRQLGIHRTASLNSTLEPIEKQTILKQLNHYQFIFAAPETLCQPAVLAKIKAQTWGLFVIDEAHCIASWGPDFRPDYLRLGSLRQELHPFATLALSATVSPTVRQEILTGLKLSPATVVELVGQLDRPKISLQHVDCVDESEKWTLLAQCLTYWSTPPATLIYVATRQKAEELAMKIRDELHVLALSFHGGMTVRDRQLIQQRFIANQVPVIVATNAFGMGIDKPNIRLVIHYQVPGNFESYFQEIGRAGRDGQIALALLFANEQDFKLRHHFLKNYEQALQLVKNNYQSNFHEIKGQKTWAEDLLQHYRQAGVTQEQAEQLLTQSLATRERDLMEFQQFICQQGCLRRTLLAHFAQQPLPQHHETCCGTDKTRTLLACLSLVPAVLVPSTIDPTSAFDMVQQFQQLFQVTILASYATISRRKGPNHEIQNQ